jgi:hypothetical protein
MECSVVNLLEEKLILLNEVLTVTQNADFGVYDESDEESMRGACEVYVGLYERRERIFERLTELDGELERFEPGGRKANREITDCAESILMLDRQIALNTEGLLKFVRRNVKELSAAKQFRVYTDDEI